MIVSSQPETDLVGPSTGYSDDPDSEHRPSLKLKFLRLVDGDQIKNTHGLETTVRINEPSEADLENTRSASMTAAGQSRALPEKVDKNVYDPFELEIMRNRSKSRTVN